MRSGLELVRAQGYHILIFCILVPRLCSLFIFDKKGSRRASRNRKKRDILQFLFILAEQSACCTIGEHASHHRHIFFDSVQPLLALSAQRALCTFFSLLLSASLLRCGLMVSSPERWASSGGRLPEALFLVFQLDSKGEIQIRFKRCRSVNFVNLTDLVKSFQTSI